MHLDHLPQVGETYLHLLQNLSLGGAARFAFLYSLSGFFKKVYMALWACQLSSWVTNPETNSTEQN